jgi:hypothetical protein
VANKRPKRPSDAAIDAHLTMIQSVINRMATNSSASKAWCVTLVSALLVVILDKGRPEFLPIAIVPVALFFSLDAYYLVQEKRFRNSYDEFIDKLHHQKLMPNDLYAIKAKGHWGHELKKALRSFSIWPFYTAMFFFVGIAYFLISGPMHR